MEGHAQRYVVFSVGWAVDGCREGLDVSNLITSVATGFSPSGGVPVTKVSRGNGDEFRAEFVARGVDGPSLRFPRAARENAMWLIVRFRTNLGRLCQMNCRYDCGVRRWWCGLGDGRTGLERRAHLAPFPRASNRHIRSGCCGGWGGRQPDQRFSPSECAIGLWRRG